MKRNYKIGLVMKSLQADFFKVMKEGAILVCGPSSVFGFGLCGNGYTDRGRGTG